VVHTGTGLLLPSFAAVAKHYGVHIDICPPRRGNRKGVVEKAIHFITQRWWRTAAVSTPAEAQASLDRFLATTGDARERGGRTVGDLATEEELRPLPDVPYPATLRRAGGSTSSQAECCSGHPSARRGVIRPAYSVNNHSQSAASGAAETLVKDRESGPPGP
jgi:hypothetical protein